MAEVDTTDIAAQAIDIITRRAAEVTDGPELAEKRASLAYLALTCISIAAEDEGTEAIHRMAQSALKAWDL